MGAKLSVYNNIAKIWAIRYGLKMAWELGYKHINLEIVSQILLNWLTTYSVLATELSVLILDCRMLLGQEWTVLPCHVFREANGVVDELAKRGQEHQCNVREYNECPNFVYVKYVCYFATRHSS